MKRCQPFCHPKSVYYFSEANGENYDDEIQKIRFDSPKPTYSIKKQKKEEKNKNLYNKIEISFPNFELSVLPKWLTLDCISIKHKHKHSSKKNLITVYIQNNSISKEKVQKKTILFCHNSSTDLGIITPFLIDLGTQLRCDVISFDYTGYGLSNGKPSLSYLIENIQTIMTYILQELKVPEKNIVLFGHGLGAIPSLYLCYNNNIQVKGLILLSPDFNQTVTKKTLEVITVSSLLIHGKKDISIPYEVLRDLCRHMKNEIEWFPKASNVEDIITNHRRKFYLKVKNFIFQQERISVQDYEDNYSTVSSSIFFMKDAKEPLFKEESENMDKMELVDKTEALEEKEKKEEKGRTIGYDEYDSELENN